MWPWAREVILDDFEPQGASAEGFERISLSGCIRKRILKDSLPLGASWPRSELSRAGGLSSFNSFNFC